MEMWYVVQVRTGTEESVRKQYEKLPGGVGIRRCFIPYYEEMRRYEGSWHKTRKVLFPGYVFIISDKANQLFYSLQQVFGLTKILGMDGTFIPLTPEETSFMMGFGGEDQVVVMSKGFLENEKVTVTEGPLSGREGFIRRIDRHKRKAWLELAMFGRLQKVEVGLEILEKEKIGK